MSPTSEVVDAMTLRCFVPPPSREYLLGHPYAWLPAAPMLGAFGEGLGDGASPDAGEGTPRLGRFLWSDRTPPAWHWEQARSAEGGTAWEPHRLRAFTR
ncbi:MAG TPA: hypothetical protein VKT82_30265 [Ktedonobacterales bacterium]|nr:hypothetical protein [Ktedonobacterales bacterium]